VHYPFLGVTSRVYPQFIDNDADSTLIAAPGLSYDMRPAGSRDLPVPPADGLWGDAEDPAPPAGEDPAPAAEADAGPPPPAPEAAAPPVTASTEDEGAN
jgi:hypothetical protein